MWTFREIFYGALNMVPDAKKTGVYKVFVPDGFVVEFSNSTDATADTNNVKSVELLKKRWSMIQSSSVEEGKRILYIGQTRDSLKTRLTAFARYGYGKVDNHRGGYPLWQISDNKELLVEIYPCDNSLEKETELLDEYIDAYGTEPIANTGTGKGSKYRYRRKTDTYELR